MKLPPFKDATTWYAIALGGLIGGRVLTRVILPSAIHRRVVRFWRAVFRYICPLLVVRIATVIRLYTFFTWSHGPIAWLRRRGFLRLWSLNDIVVLLAFWGANFSSLFVFYSSMSDTGKRAGRLSVINLIILYAGPHLSFLADLVGLTIPTYRRLHASVATTSLCMAILHVVVAGLDRISFPLQARENLFGLIVSNLVQQSVLHRELIFWNRLCCLSPSRAPYSPCFINFYPTSCHYDCINLSVPFWHMRAGATYLLHRDSTPTCVPAYF